MSDTLDRILETVRITGVLSPGDRLDLQRAVYDDGEVSLVEADILFLIHDHIDTSACVEWPDVFVGALTDLMIRQSLPYNHVSEAEGAWLMARIDRDGSVRGATEMALLLNVLRHAVSAPERLGAYAVEQVRRGIVERGFVTAEDTERLREVLHACGSSGGVGITRAEANTLFEIADATRSARNDDSFEDLFVGAMLNHLMMSAAPAHVPTEEALRREAWLASPEGGILSGLRDALRSPFASSREVLRDGVAEEPPTVQDWLRPDVLADAERIDLGEAEWLRDRIAADGRRSALEDLLLATLREESPSIHAALFAPRIAA